MSNSATPWTAACQPPLSFTISCSLFKFLSFGSVMLSNHLILCHLFLLLPSIFPSIRESITFPVSWLVTSDGQGIRVSASASVLPMNIQDWFLWDELVGSACSPRDLKSLLQYHSSKVSILQYSAFFILQIFHPYMTTGKT